MTVSKCFRIYGKRMSFNKLEENDSNLRNILAKLNLAVFIASVQSKKVDCRSKNFSKGVKLNGILGRIKPEGINYVP